MDDLSTNNVLCSRGLGSEERVDGRVVIFPSASPNGLRVTVYDPLISARGRIRSKDKNYATGNHVK
ncbi:hypothetical protein [Sulfolobus sp. S-194]|uniref:hypothetical protein n=1 Tax=Sulfolobus sp. S-194 TaxID=2512240 RepID=UPI00336A454D